MTRGDTRHDATHDATHDAVQSKFEICELYWAWMGAGGGFGALCPNLSDSAVGGGRCRLLLLGCVVWNE